MITTMADEVVRVTRAGDALSVIVCNEGMGSGIFM